MGPGAFLEKAEGVGAPLGAGGVSAERAEAFLEDGAFWGEGRAAAGGVGAKVAGISLGGGIPGPPLEAGAFLEVGVLVAGVPLVAGAFWRKKELQLGALWGVGQLDFPW